MKGRMGLQCLAEHRGDRMVSNGEEQRVFRWTALLRACRDARTDQVRLWTLSSIDVVLRDFDEHDADLQGSIAYRLQWTSFAQRPLLPIIVAFQDNSGWHDDVRKQLILALLTNYWTDFEVWKHHFLRHPQLHADLSKVTSYTQLATLFLIGRNGKRANAP